jgi:hypothetical protein
MLAYTPGGGVFVDTSPVVGSVATLQLTGFCTNLAVPCQGIKGCSILTRLSIHRSRMMLRSSQNAVGPLSSVALYRTSQKYSIPLISLSMRRSNNVSVPSTRLDFLHISLVQENAAFAATRRRTSE